jgi:hypothetical protein
MLKSLFILSLLSVVLSHSSVRNNKYDFPVPPHTKKTLFYIQRSTNANTVMYEVNVQSGKTIDPKNPVDVYWLRYAEKGQKRDLNYIERVLAYGVNCKESGNGYYTLNFVASKKKVLRIYIDETGQAQAEMNIANTSSRLERIFVTATDNDWFPKVAYVEFFGTDLSTGKSNYEKMII